LDTLAFTHEIANLRLGLFDLGGVLYHANYFALLEEAREAFLAAKDLPYHTLASNNQHLAIVESVQKFIKPIRYGDAVKIYLTTSQISKISFSFNYEIFLWKNEIETLAHKASTKMVFVEEKNGELKPTILPERLNQITKELNNS
jgi:acyl-CoA thioester hydrolase